MIKILPSFIIIKRLCCIIEKSDDLIVIEYLFSIFDQMQVFISKNLSYFLKF